MAESPKRTAHPAIDSKPDSKQDSGSGCLVRIGWLLVGNAILVVSTRSIVLNHEGFVSLADLVFWAAVLGMIALRHLDIARLEGRTVTGEPATLSHWRRYAVLMSVAAAVVWAAAHGLAYWRG